MDVLERVGRKAQSFDTLKSNDDVMRFLDMDPHLSRIFRGSVFEKATALIADGLGQQNGVITQLIQGSTTTENVTTASLESATGALPGH
jgi:hypothetical protein